jgi:pyruvate dehydrogenase E2 component (dihydrolipoamide acetyltransferase)
LAFIYFLYNKDEVTMPGIRLIEVPKWGLSMEEGTVVNWLIPVGAAFSEGDEICDLETSKISNVVEAPFAGVLRRVLADVGVTLPVGAPLAVSAAAETTEAEIDVFLTGSGSQEPAATVTAPAPRPPEVQAVAQTAVTASPASLSGTTDETVVATPEARAYAEAHGLNLAKVTASGRGGRVSVADIAVALAANGAEVTPADPVRATPLARRVAGQLGIDLTVVAATGPRGRVQRADVERSAQLPLPSVSPAGSKDTPITGMRKVIAERLTASARDIPQFRLNAAIRLDALLDLRAELNAGAAQKISVTDLIVKAAGRALMQVPACNVQVLDGLIRQFEAADICLAVALPGGLMTPKIEAVNAKSLSTVARETAALVEAARVGKLMPDQMTGGTFTISNLGMFGIDSFDAIINPPQGAILAVGAGRSEGHGYMNGDKPATIMNVTLTCDHRAIDGALGAQLLQALRETIEAPLQIVI